MPNNGKTKIVESALSIDTDQCKQIAQANPDRHVSPSVDFMFQESLLYIYIPLRRNVSVRIKLHGLLRLMGRYITQRP